METINLTFKQFRDVGISLDITHVMVYPNGDIGYKIKNPNLWHTKPWGGLFTDNRKKALFAHLPVGSYKVTATYA